MAKYEEPHRPYETTRMLLELMTYISDNQDEEKLVVLSAHTIEYAWVLAEKVMHFFNCKRRLDSAMIFGRVKMVVARSSHVGMYTHKGIRIDKHFKDGY